MRSVPRSASFEGSRGLRAAAEVLLHERGTQFDQARRGRLRARRGWLRGRRCVRGVRRSRRAHFFRRRRVSSRTAGSATGSPASASADPTGITPTGVHVTAGEVSGAGHAATVEEPGVDGCCSLAVPFGSALVANAFDQVAAIRLPFRLRSASRALRTWAEARVATQKVGGFEVDLGRNRSRPAVRCELCSIPGAAVKPHQMTRKRLETVAQWCRSGLERACGAGSGWGPSSPLGHARDGHLDADDKAQRIGPAPGPAGPRGLATARDEMSQPVQSA